MLGRIIVLIPLLIATSFTNALEDAHFWKQQGQNKLRETLNVRHRFQAAKNIIVFIGDGMGMSTITAGRIFKGQHQPNPGPGEEFILTWEKFPYIGLSKTYNVDKQVPDSAATATAIFTGVKTKYYTLGFDAQAKLEVCDSKVNRQAHLTSAMLWAQKAGKDTGIVTTTRITHATPAATYAHANHRDWECDEEIPEEFRNCTIDIARQLIEQEPGNAFKVILGGGQKQMGIFKGNNSIDDSCWRMDGRDLVSAWLADKPNATFVKTKEELLEVDVTTVSHILGVFSPSHIPYGFERTEEHPSLVNMTIQAIRLLQRNPNGFLLLVEGGRIDQAHHDNWAQLALAELSELDDAVAAALRYVNLDETLILVTADHSHAFTLNGYPKRGNDILGIGNKKPGENDEPIYETLTYANGPAFLDHWDKDHFRNITSMNRTDPKYRHFAPTYLEDETHAGEDVPVYAIGPLAHLLTGVFEQNYIAHVLGYAGCFGDGFQFCSDYNSKNSRGAASSTTSSTILFFLSFLFSTFIIYC